MATLPEPKVKLRSRLASALVLKPKITRKQIVVAGIIALIGTIGLTTAFAFNANNGDFEAETMAVTVDGTPTPGPVSGGCSNGGVAAPCVGGPTTGATGWGSPTFDDEFNGTGLDTSKWSTGWFGSGVTAGVGGSSENDCYDPAQVVESNGELDLNLIKKTETCGGTTHAYATGFVTTDQKYSYSYGFVEARMWLSPRSGSTAVADWPAFWQDGQNWPSDGELDLMEGLDGQPCAHWHGPSSGDGVAPNIGSGCVNGNFTSGWHTFGANWNAQQVTWYYDGVSIGSLTAAQASQYNNSLVSGPQYLILGLGIGSDLTAPTSQRMDYVRVWQ